MLLGGYTMKKLLSVIVTVAMLVSCMAPSLTVGAAEVAEEAGAALVIADASFDPAARDANAKTTVSIANNPGFCYGVFYLYYDNTVFDVAEGAVAGLVGDDYKVATTYNNDSTGRTIKNALKAAGVEAADNIKCVEIEIEGDANYTGNDLASVVLNVVKSADEIAEGDVLTYGIVAGEVVNADDDEVTVAAGVGSATAAADPNTPIYEDKQFDDVTIYADTVTVNKGTKTVEVAFCIDGHNEVIDAYGINTALFRIVYPKELKLVSTRLGNIIKGDPEDTLFGITLDAYNFADESYTPSNEVKAECEWSGYDWENSDDYITSATFDGDITTQSFERGAFAYATFELPDDASGTYDIKLISFPENLFAVAYETAEDIPQPTVIPFAIDNGAIKVVIRDCKHEAEYLVESGEESTCTVEGWKKVECTYCGQVVSEEKLPLAEHVEGEKVVTKEPTFTEEGAYEVKCAVCETVLETGVIPTIDDIYFTIGDVSAKFGDSVVIPVNISNNKNGMFIAAIDVTFDPAQLTFKGFTAGELVENVTASEYEAGKIRIYFENEEDFSNIVGDGLLVNLEFDIVYDETLAGADVKVSASADENSVVDADGVALTTVFVDGNVTVEAREATFYVGTAEAPFGKEVTIPVSVKNNPGMFIGIFDVSYDASVLEYVGFEAATEVFGENAYVYAVKVQDGKVQLYFENDVKADVTASGVLGNLKFVVVEDDVLVGETLEVSITGADENILNYEGVTFDHGFAAGGVTVADRATVKVGDGTAKYGQNVVVPVVVENNPGFFIGIFDVKYDPTVLTFLDYEDGELANENYYVKKVADGEIRVYIENVEKADITADGVITNLAFAVADNYTLVGDELAVSIVPADNGVLNFEGNALDFGYVAGGIEVLDREKITVDDQTVEYAHEVKVPVNVTNNVGFWGAIVEFTFDDTALKFVGVENGVFEVTADENCSVHGNVVTVFVENTDLYADVTDDCTLYTLVFKAIAENVASDIDVEILEIFNQASEYVNTFVSFGGTISTVPCTHSEYVAETTLEPTYEADGWKEYYCKFCDVDLNDGEVIPMLVERIVVDTVEAVAGDEITVPVYLLDNRGVWSIGLEIAYDTAALEFVGVENGLFDVSRYNIVDKNGVISICTNNAGDADVMENDVVFNLKFKVAYTAEGEVAIDASMIADETINMNGAIVGFTVIDGAVNVTAHEHTASAEAPTCTEDVVCTVCGVVLTEATGHTEVVDAAIEATCWHYGLTEGKHCEVCGAATVPQTIVPTVEHTWADEFTVDVAPAIGVEGEQSKHCTVDGCDARTEVTPIPALPATYTQTLNGVESEVEVGTKVTISSELYVGDGYAFDYWAVESDNVTLELDAEALENSYVMPSEDVVINSVKYLIGDVNGNGEVEATDLLELASAVKTGAEVDKYIDVNNDGELAATDLLVLAQIIKGTYDYSDYIG